MRYELYSFMHGEARSRTDTGLTNRQQVLAKAVGKENPNTDVAREYVRTPVIPGLGEKASANECTWQPYSEGGRASQLA